MNKKVASILGATALLVAVSAGPAAAAPGGGNSCVGQAVSSSAHFFQQQLHTGLGAEAHALGVNLGQVIQSWDATFCDSAGG